MSSTDQSRDRGAQDGDATTGGPGSLPGTLFDLSGRTFLVTGAGRGLGRAMALAIGDAGGTVVGVARSADQLAETASASRGRFVAMAADLQPVEGLVALEAQIHQRVGPVYGVVHAAGSQLRKPAVEVTSAEWDDMLALNCTVPFFLSAALGRRQMADGRPGVHLFVASLASRLGFANVAPYSAAKSGVLGIMRSLAVEWAPHRIRVNALIPGYFPTELTRPVVETPTALAKLTSRIPMERLGEPAELAGMAIALLGDSGRYVTGQAVAVDGGWSAS